MSHVQKFFKKFFFTLGKSRRFFLLGTFGGGIVFFAASVFLAVRSLSGAFTRPVSAGEMLFFSLFFAAFVMVLGVCVRICAKDFSLFARRIRLAGIGTLFVLFAADGLAVSSGASRGAQLIFGFIWLAELAFFARLEFPQKTDAHEISTLKNSEEPSQLNTESKIEPKTTSEPESKLESESKLEPESESEPESKLEPESESETEDFFEEECEEELLPADTSQQLRRFETPDAEDVLSGLLRAVFVPNQRKVTLFVAFCPVFSCIPTVECEAVEGEATVEAAQTTPCGVRLVVSKSRFVPFEDSAVLKFTAREKKPKPT